MKPILLAGETFFSERPGQLIELAEQAARWGGVSDFPGRLRSRRWGVLALCRARVGAGQIGKVSPRGEHAQLGDQALGEVAGLAVCL